VRGQQVDCAQMVIAGSCHLPGQVRNQFSTGVGNKHNGRATHGWHAASVPGDRLHPVRLEPRCGRARSTGRVRWPWPGLVYSSRALDATQAVCSASAVVHDGCLVIADHSERGLARREA